MAIMWWDSADLYASSDLRPWWVFHYQYGATVIPPSPHDYDDWLDAVKVLVEEGKRVRKIPYCWDGYVTQKSHEILSKFFSITEQETYEETMDRREKEELG
jgi:hypothetical protein